MKKAVCLISGGIDSFLSAYIAKKKGYKIYCLTIDYGQKSRKELLSAKKVAKFLKAEEHLILKINLKFLKSALTRDEIKIPERKIRGIPSTYVPARNTIFISLALGYAESISADAIFIGVNSVDFSGYPDCRPIYIKRYQKLIDVATKKTVSGKRIKLLAPLINLSKKEIIKRAISYGLDLSLTWSCYKNEKRPCGKCPSCRIREKAISEIKKSQIKPER
ncbi:MAG: 7-cyano-7-deazaguanine synthase QueC [Candidatus Omnitrophica bacterium]|nr:7-cyano-7-deazaguanine synthase QueC [Candidatus Omnitrophota bacterium]MCM8807512.1 7-cyano-7-deazaguanine synthase QueC [Candidatus Omnitrophota bacterium]